MRHLLSLTLMCSLLAACADAPQRRGSAEVAQMRTVDSVPPQPAQLQQPPMLTDEAPPPKPKALNQWDIPKAVILSPEDEKVRGSLPFTPAIAMDPVDGSKISIRANTPTYEYKGKIYYFSSEENRQQFTTNPDEAIKGSFTKL
jgi:YHS domain-containing protein